MNLFFFCRIEFAIYSSQTVLLFIESLDVFWSRCKRRNNVVFSKSQWHIPRIECYQSYIFSSCKIIFLGLFFYSMMEMFDIALFLASQYSFEKIQSSISCIIYIIDKISMKYYSTNIVIYYMYGLNLAELGRDWRSWGFLCKILLRDTKAATRFDQSLKNFLRESTIYLRISLVCLKANKERKITILKAVGKEFIWRPKLVELQKRSIICMNFPFAELVTRSAYDCFFFLKISMLYDVFIKKQFFAKTNLKSTFKHAFLCVACEIYLIRYCDFKSIQMPLVGVKETWKVFNFPSIFHKRPELLHKSTKKCICSKEKCPIFCL